LRADALHQLATVAPDPVRAGELLAEAARLAARELGPEDAYRHGLAHVDLLVNRVRVNAAKQAFIAVEEAALKSGNPALHSEMLGWKALIAAMAGEADDATRFVEEGMRIAIAHQLPEQVAFAYKRRANIADYAGNYSLEKHSHDVAIRYCREVQAGEAIVCMGCLSYACFRTGDWKEALDTAREVLGQSDLHPGLRSIAGGVKGMIAAFRGERGGAFKYLDEALRLQRAEGMAGMEFLTLWALAYWHDCQGEAAKARAIYDEIRTLWRESDDLHDSIPGLLFAGAHYADHGQMAALADCIDILGVILGRNDLPEARAALLALGAEQTRLEGDAESCDQALREAAALEIKAGLPLEQLWIESRRKSVEDRKEAIALATRLGAKPLLASLKGGACGDSGSDLTPRQCEVLSFLASGLTSKEIGDRMGLSTRTVEMHVGRIFERLNCRTRPEAVALAQSRGWIKLP
jgi:DNA-binding NarL/FixJ family response regulator